MAFIVKNDGFVCDYCGAVNPPGVGTCRNHCFKCLCSQHVDNTSPGDRASTCHGKMIPVSVLSGSRKSDYVLLHVCEKCGKEMKNRVLPDDDFEAILAISQKHIYG